ncbi:hypothetical protein Fmac_020769 [Flemingia macrophylla]|uniref:Uncharacterized protein n=1 Tax=Flemingia macrophylla TaxID=520843 RepID=A0ABD1LUY0_9FABA
MGHFILTRMVKRHAQFLLLKDQHLSANVVALIAPNHPFIKLNIDGKYLLQQDVTGIIGVPRDNSSRCWCGGESHSNVGTREYGEALYLTLSSHLAKLFRDEVQGRPLRLNLANNLSRASLLMLTNRLDIEGNLSHKEKAKRNNKCKYSKFYTGSPKHKTTSSSQSTD